MGGGQYITPLHRVFLNLSGGTVSGDTLFTQNLSASTFYSGSTNLGDLISGALTSVVTGSTRIQDGLNTYTGGTQFFPSVNVSGLTIDNIRVSGTSLFFTLSASTLSGGTIFSGSTNINSLFADKIHTHSISDVIGLSGTLSTKANLSGATFTGQVIAPSLSATTLSGGTIFSGSTNINSLFADKIHTHSISDITGLSGALSTKANLSGATFTGQVNAPSLSAVTISGGTFYSGSTPLSQIIQLFSDGNDLTRIQNGTNTYTGGTSNFPTVNVSALTISTLRVSGSSLFSSVSATTISGGTIFSGSTNINSLFADKIHTHSISDITNLQGELDTKANLSGASFSGAISGPSATFSSFSGSSAQITSLSGTNIFSGSSNLNTVFAPRVHTHTIPDVTGLSGALSTKANLSGATFTGTVSGPTANFSSISGSSAQITSLSGTNIFSGSSNLNTVFAPRIHTHVISDISNLQGSLDTKANLSGATFTGSVLAPSLSASTLSGGTIYSGSSNINSLFADKIHTHSIPDITGLSGALSTKANLSGASFSGSVTSISFSATTLSGGTIYSGSTDLSALFAPAGSVGALTKVQPGLNTYTGGTITEPTVNVSALTIDSIRVSGDSIFGPVTATTITATTISATTYVSGGTLLETIIRNIATTTESITRIQPGTNTYTGGTVTAPTVNVSALTINRITATGGTGSSFAMLSATTIFSGSTDINSLFADKIHTHVISDITGLSGALDTKANLSGATFTGHVRVPNLSANTIFSGSTNINSLFADKIHTHVISDVTGLSGALSTKANLSGATFTGTISGTRANFGLFSGTSAQFESLTGDTIFSGGTDINSLFADKIHTHAISGVTGLQGQLDTKANLSGASFTGKITGERLEFSIISGSSGSISSFVSLSLSGTNNIFSGSTDLDEIFAPKFHTHPMSAITGLQGALDTKANLSGATFTDTISGPTANFSNFSGSSGQITSLRGTSLSGGTIFSGSTNVSELFMRVYAGLSTKFDKSGGTVNGDVLINGNVQIIGTATTINTQTVQAQDNNILLNFSGTHLTAIGGGITLLSGQTSGAPSVINSDSDGNWVSNVEFYAPVFSGTSIVGTNIFSGGTNLNSVFAPRLHTHTIANVTGLQGALDTKANLSGASFTGTISGPTAIFSSFSGSSGQITALRGTSLSGGTIFSGATNLDSIIRSLVSGNTDIVRVQNGLNTYTGGTGNAPTVNVSALTISTLAASGASRFVSLSGVSISASTFYSGSTNLSSLFQLAGTEDVTRVQNGLNTYTGGTANSPTVNVSGLTVQSIVASGSSRFVSISGTSVSASTFYSGSTDLSQLFQLAGTEDVTRIQNGLNTYTGGTANSPTVNVSALTVNSIIVSGDSRFVSLSASSFSASSIFINTQQVHGTVVSATPPVDSGSTWIRSTDYSTFIFDATRGIWLSTSEQLVSGARNSAAAGTQFLRHYDGTQYNDTPYRMPYDATITKIIIEGASAADIWRGVVTTGTTIGTNDILSLGVSLNSYSAKTDVSVSLYSGQTIYLAFSGTSINRPRVDMYFKQRGS